MIFGECIGKKKHIRNECLLLESIIFEAKCRVEGHIAADNNTMDGNASMKMRVWDEHWTYIVDD